MTEVNAVASNGAQGFLLGGKTRQEPAVAAGPAVTAAAPVTQPELAP